MARKKETTTTSTPPEVPHGKALERFTCNSAPNFSFTYRDDIVRFQSGELITDDPGMIKAICSLQGFGNKIIPDNRELLPDWMKALPGAKK